MPWLAQAVTKKGGNERRQGDDRERISIPIEPMKHMKKRTILKDAPRYWTNEGGALPAAFLTRLVGRGMLSAAGTKKNKEGAIPSLGAENLYVFSSCLARD
jgi:hypothetical protein